jgi:thiol-disulfide isomerase/thioredoxin
MKKKLIYLFVIILPMLSCKKEDDNSNTQPLANQLRTINSVNDFDAQIKQGVSLFFFHATWCSICANQRPAVEGLVKDPSFNKVFFGQVDFEKNRDTNQKYNITGFPTIIIFKDNVERHRLTGQGHSQEKLAGLLRDLL